MFKTRSYLFNYRRVLQFLPIFQRAQHTRMSASHVKKWYKDITKSAEDKRDYLGLELENDMKVMLISDPSTDKSAAAMDVHIGHMSDPTELPGLAHFCEHMLFLGTKKYPEENEYSQYLNEHGGSSNAFTSGEHTNYYFDVAPEDLKGALNRFSQFFLCPLFTESATEREVNAVNSENDKNLASDMWRLHQLEKATCKEDHDFFKFGTGNKDTLLIKPKEKGIDTRQELLKFHTKYYSSNIMSLVVLGKESLGELEEMVVPMFCDVENKRVEIPEWEEHPVGPDQVQRHAEIVPVKDLRSLNVTWPIPDLHPYYKSSPGHLLGHLIGHEGAGSLLSELKNRSWSNSLVGGVKSGARGFSFFIVNVDLTETGIEHTDDIITIVFQYLKRLQAEGPQQWVFNECRDLSAMSFRFKDKEKPRSYVYNLAQGLRDYPLEHTLIAPYVLEEYRPDLIDMVLSKLTPDTIRVAVVGKKFKGTTDKTEKWYGTEYRESQISAETLQKWKNASLHDNLKLPRRNEFIPTNFDSVTRESESIEVPQVIRNTDMTRLWFKQDNTYLLPKCCITIDVTSPYAYMDPLSADLNSMFVIMFKDALNEYSYDAELAGLSYGLNSTIYGLTLSFRGYNDKQHVLLKKVLEKMATFSIDEKRFEILKENYVRNLKNFQAEQPHQHAIYYTNLLMSEQIWTKDELLDAADEMSVEKLQTFIPQLLSRLYLEFLIYGNVTSQKAVEICDLVENTLKSKAATKPLPSSQQRRFREVQLPDGCYFVYKRENSVHKSSSLEVYYQCSLQETKSNVMLELFVQIIGEPCFNILRTQEQLGYIVFSGIRRSSGVQGLRVIVQSDRSPEYVESRIEAFLLKMEKHLSEMEADVFEKHVHALATKRLEKAKKLSGQNSRYWGEIISQQYNFDRDEIEVKELKTISKKDVLDFYKDLIAHNAPKRHKVCVHVVSTGNSDSVLEMNSMEETKEVAKDLDEAPALGSCDEVKDISVFKRELGLFPLPKPFITINPAKSKL